MVIEDDRALNGGIVFALEKEGYHVHSAYTLQEAEKSLKQRMNLILLDINLPDGDGRAFLQSVLAGQPVPVLLLTARDSEEDMVRGFQAGLYYEALFHAGAAYEDRGGLKTQRGSVEADLCMRRFGV